MRDKATVNNVLFLRRSYRNLGVAGLLFFSGMAVLSVYAALTDVPKDRRVFALLPAFWGLWIVLSIWILLAYWRGFLAFLDGRIIERGVIRRREMSFSEIIEVRWLATRSGRVALRSAFQRIRIDLDNFEPDQQLWLIRLLRSSLPQSIQRDWERFCYKVALPLAKPDVDRPLTDSEVLITRRRWDWYFVPVILLSTVAGVLCAWFWHTPRFLSFPLLPAIAWLMMRFTTPRKGIRSVRVSKTPERGFLLFLLIWFLVSVAVLAACKVFRPQLPHEELWAWTGMALWMVVLLVVGCIIGHQMDRRRQQREQPLVRAAAEEWERLETGDSTDAPKSLRA